MAVLQQQVGELRVDTETCSVEHLTGAGDTGPSSGTPQLTDLYLNHINASQYSSKCILSLRETKVFFPNKSACID